MTKEKKLTWHWWQCWGRIVRWMGDSRMVVLLCFFFLFSCVFFFFLFLFSCFYVSSSVFDDGAAAIDGSAAGASDGGLGSWRWLVVFFCVFSLPFISAPSCSFSFFVLFRFLFYFCWWWSCVDSGSRRFSWQRWERQAVTVVLSSALFSLFSCLCISKQFLSVFQSPLSSFSLFPPPVNSTLFFPSVSPFLSVLFFSFSFVILCKISHNSSSSLTFVPPWFLSFYRYL